MKGIQLLGVSGSLRQRSTNTRLLQAARLLAPEGVSVVLYEGLGQLPHFNPDLDDDNPPPSVRELRARVKAADGVLICSPEYAAGVPGSMKNALDWLVGSTDIVDKPTAAINGSPWSTQAHASLLVTLTMISARVVSEACIAVPLRGNGQDARGLALDASIGPPVKESLAALTRVILKARAPA